MNIGMKKYYNQPIIYLPALHRQLIYDHLPNEVLLLNPGLPQTSYEQTPNAQTQPNNQQSLNTNEPLTRFTSPHLVYPPRIAEACLRDLLNFEETVQDLSAAAAMKIVGQFWNALSPLENDDLIAFVQNGGKLDTSKLKDLHHEIKKSVKVLYQEVYEQAQKNLLLTWSHEENILSIAELLLKASKSTAELRANIKEPTHNDDIAQELLNSITPSSLWAETSQNELLNSPQAEPSINDLIDEIMQESGLSSHDLQPEWSAVLIGALCLTEPETLFYTTEPEFYQLLSEIYPDEENLPQTINLSEQDILQLFPSVEKNNNFAICKIPYTKIGKVYTSPLLKRLMWLEQDKRHEVTFIYKT